VAQLEAVCGAIEQALAEELELEPHNVFITVQPVWTPG